MYIFPEYADPAAPHSPQYPENLMFMLQSGAGRRVRGSRKRNRYGILYYSSFNTQSLLINDNVQNATYHRLNVE
jgi:hypothetical protein